MKNKLQTSLCFIITLLLSNTALGQDNKTLDASIQIQALKQRLAILENKVSEEKKQTPNDVIFNLKPYPSFKTRDEKTSLTLNGRMMFDAGMVTKDKNPSLKNATSLRRLWLGANGHINKDWRFQTLIGFENNETTVTDAFITYSGLNNADILVGNFFENNGLDVNTPNLINPFMERSSSITTFRQLRRTGASFNPYANNWGGHFGVFGSDPNNASSSTNKSTGFSGRAHYAAINDKENVHFLHLGFNSTYRTPESATNLVRFKSTGNSNVINGLLIDTGNINNIDNFYQNMAELRYQKGPLTITSEYIQTNLRRTGASDLQFNGGYLMASYFLTGEKYGYNAQTGTALAAPVSKGTWEVATRYSMTDLNNKDVAGGKLNSYDFGVNYYAHKQLKFMANYIINHVDQSARLQKQNPHYLLLRAQVNF